ncbi:MAG TPA: CHAT domain-containing tetratricopeptide repeat protein [Rhodanobacteraceae bacterium]|nr:CHAT domain-containing tetratricopeptide repeat protein [Rhodanobacteraceae bacterium]
MLSGALALAHAAGAPVPPAVDKIELASGAGDFAAALRLSADLLQQTPAADPARVAALQARLDAIVDSSEWSAQSAPLRAAIETLPDASLREAMLASFAAAEAAIAANANAMLEVAQKSLEKNLSAPPTFNAEMHGVAARASILLGRADAAASEGQLALDAWRRQAGVRARRNEISLYLAFVQIRQMAGKNEDALLAAEAATRIAVEVFGANSLARIRADDQHAAVLEALDRYAEARELREGTLKASVALYGAHHLRAAQAESALGAHLQRTGSYAQAREHYAAADSIMRALPDVGVRDRIIFNNNYANLLQEMGDEDAAFEHYHVALELATDNRTRAMILTNIGNTEFRLQHYDKAIADFNQALPLREQAEGKDSPSLSFALEGLGSSALALKRFADAQQYFARAVELRGKASAPNHSHLNVLNFGLALADWGLGDDAEAFRLAVQTAERQQSLLGSLATGFSEQQSVGFDNLLVPATALAVTIAAAHGKPQEIAIAWRLVMVERGLIGRAEARRLAIARASADPGLAQLYRDWRAANSALGDAWLSSKTNAARMAELQSSAEAAERTLWAKLGYQQADLVAGAAPTSDLAKALPPDGVLVAFSEGVGTDAARIVNAGTPQAAEDLYAFVLRPHSSPKLLRIGRIDALTAQTRAWYGGLRDPQSDLAQLRARGEGLRRDLFGRIDGLEKSTLFVIPFGDLFRISFAALPDSGSDRYWIESGLRVQTLAHESELLMPASPPHAIKALLAGAPEFGPPSRPSAPPGQKVEKATAVAARQLCTSVAEHGFPAIPGAARELDGLRDLLHGTLGAKGNIRVIDGSQATKENVLAALGGVDIVHIATHGFSFDESCGSATARGMTVDRSRVGPRPVAQPLSGLAFAGADVSGGHAPIGVLSAGEISAADLSHAEWVVLSACDSGLGPIGHNEGVFGMRRALRLAGARTVVMSLWEADDATTADLMQALYRARFAERRNVPDAMAQAMRTTIAARRSAHESTHPYYWAAFIGEGGWR